MKKVIAVMVALMFAAVLFNINVSAMTKQEYEQQILSLLYDFKNGTITYEQYKQYSDEVTSRYVEANTDSNGVIDSVAVNVTNTVNDIVEKVGESIQKSGNAVYDWISDIFNDYEKEEASSTTDLRGYGAMVHRLKIIGSYGEKYYSEYVVLYENGDGSYTVYIPAPFLVYSEAYDSESISNSSYSIVYDPEKVKLYGDIRYSDGSEAPSDDEYETKSILKIDELTDSELDELLEDILEELERQTPDLSTIEGLLEAIYYQVCGINDKMITYDQCNALIMSLISSNDENAQDIIKALFEIRDTLKENDGTSEDENPDDETTSDDETTGDDETGEHPAHICGTLYNVKPLDKNWLNKLMTDKTELKVEYQGSTYYLESCGCLLLDDKYYSVDMNYDNYMSIDYDFNNENITIDNSKYVDVDFKNYNTMWANLSTSQKNKINSVIELIYKMIEQSVPYSMVTTTLQAFQLVVFNTATPEDIVLTINSTNVLGQEIDGFEVTLLSTSFFQNSSVSSAIKIIKSFLTVVIGYAWLLAMRKKVTAMLG